ncbi:MFS transporter [Micromonospora sp. NPDC049366]|uniref:MFS transporter n=1 Tax=Micromonospora sp. NPDC049366 TaxID=3364271 RepID=UPI0037A6A7A9
MTGLVTAPAPPRPGGLLRHRDFRLLWTAQTVSSVGSNVTTVALPLVAVAVLDATTFQVAVLTAAAGVLTVGHLLAAALGAGLARVFFETADQVYLPVVLRPADLPEGNAKLQATQTASYVIGPGLAGLIAQAVGTVAALLLDALTFLVSAVSLARIRTREPRPAPVGPGRSLRHEIADGLRFVARDPYLRVLTLFGAASNIGLVGYQAVKGSFRQTYAPHHLLGRVTVSMQLLNYGTIPVAALAAGALGSAYGARTAVLAMTGWLAATPLIMLIGPLRRRRDLPAAPAT